MAAPTNLTVTYLISSGAPTVTNVASVSVSISSIGGDYSTAVRNIESGNGLWYTDATGLLTFIPHNQIVEITAA
jgi:hypothetical protein